MLDLILESSVCSSNYELMLKSHIATFEMLTKENVKVLAEATKTIQASESTLSEATAKVEKLYADVMKFMDDFRKSSNENTESVNKEITGLGSTLRNEKDALLRVCSQIQADNSELNIAIEPKIEKLQADLALENSLMYKSG